MPASRVGLMKAGRKPADLELMEIDEASLALLHERVRHDAKKGLASLCNVGGLDLALAVAR